MTLLGQARSSWRPLLRVIPLAALAIPAASPADDRSFRVLHGGANLRLAVTNRIDVELVRLVMELGDPRHIPRIVDPDFHLDAERVEVLHPGGGGARRVVPFSMMALQLRSPGVQVRRACWAMTSTATTFPRSRMGISKRLEATGSTLPSPRRVWASGSVLTSETTITRTWSIARRYGPVCPSEILGGDFVSRDSE